MLRPTVGQASITLHKEVTMIEVRVRCIQQAEATHLGWFTPEEIPQIPNLFKTFPSFDLDRSGMYLDAAQFVIDVDSVYLEIVVSEEE